MKISTWFRKNILGEDVPEEIGQHTAAETFKHVNGQYQDELFQKYVEKLASRVLRIFRNLDTQYVFLIFHKFCAQRLANMQSEKLQSEGYPELQKVYSDIIADMESLNNVVAEAYRLTKANEEERDAIFEEKGL